MVLATQAAMNAAVMDGDDDDISDPSAQLLAANPSPEAANQMEAITQALSAAAAPAAAAAAGVVTEWNLKVGGQCRQVPVQAYVYCVRPLLALSPNGSFKVHEQRRQVCEMRAVQAGP